MRTTNLVTALRHLRTLADARADRDLTDADLLERFRAQGDEAAFTLLVQRHGPMVLGVCRRILSNPDDAEDAFQATFLVLARAAAAIRKQASVASWLYGVAQRTAGKARVQEISMQAREQRGAAMRRHESLDPTDELTWRDLRGVLDEELGQLPERYRAPLALCYLEGKTAEQAAGELGVPRGTLSWRLAKAREVLRGRLQERGVTLTGGLLAALLAQKAASAAVPASLTLATVRAASLVLAGKALSGGVVSVNAIKLAEGVTNAMGLTRLKTATLVLLLTGALLAGAGGAALRLSARTPAVGESPPASRGASDAPAPEREKSSRVEVRGRVFGPDGKPFAGAKVYLGHGGSEEKVYPERAVSDTEGRFRFSLARSELGNSDSEKPAPQVLAVGGGHGCDWIPLSPGGEELTLRLVKDVPINGRILDADGSPVGGAKLKVWAVFAMKDEDLGPYLEALRKGDDPTYAKRWPGPLPGQPTELTADRDGRFRLAGAGRERLVIFRVEGQNIAWTSFEVMTRAGASARNPRRNSTIHAASFTFVGSHSRPIRGVVRDKETGKPLAGVSVGEPGNSWRVAATDKEGRFDLPGLPKSEKYSLVARPPDGSYFQRHVQLHDAPGLGPLICDIELLRGLSVRGKVTDRATGKPVVGAKVDYHPLGGNGYVDKLVSGSWQPQSETTTGSDGSYSLTVLPGPGVLGVKAPKLAAYMTAAVPLKERKAFFKTPLAEDRDEEFLSRYVGGGAYGGLSTSFYNAIVLLEPREKEGNLLRDVALKRPQERKGWVVGPDGRPLTGVTVYGLAHFAIDTLKGDEFTVRGVNPKAKRPLVFFHKEKRLGFYLKDLRDEAGGPLTVKLQPCGSASGRVVDRDGEPVSGLRLHVTGRALRIIGESGGGYHQVTTDKAGRFRVEGLVPGQDYAVEEWGKSPGFPRVHAQVAVKSDEHKDMGNLKMTERGE
jgi:RNA polymerase sigma factor (sigma-70 family)